MTELMKLYKCPMCKSARSHTTNVCMLTMFVVVDCKCVDCGTTWSVSTCDMLAEVGSIVINVRPAHLELDKPIHLN